jgi:REP element-mobilizing transposase RayT
MGRSLQRHQQQELFGPRGGKRVVAGRAPVARKKKALAQKPKRPRGRPRKGARAGSPHKKRPELKPRYPVHAVLRVHSAIGSLRKRFMYQALREATLSVALRELHDRETGAFRIVHISIQRDHVHLIVEADNKTALSRGMQSFQISAAKHLNRAVSRDRAERRRGAVFPDRFYQEIIKTPTQARNALSYVLNNWRKHREDRGELQRTWKVDPFSTGALFMGWKELEGQLWMWPLRETYQPLVVYRPTTWLLREGWERAGSITYRTVPSTRLVHDVA